MHSSQENLGLKLLSKWKTKLESTSKPTSVRVSFTGTVTFTGTGVVTFSDVRELRVHGIGFDLTLALDGAVFENVVTAEYLRSRGADPSLCGEGLDVVSDWGRVNLTTFLGESKPN
jgi:hypothetical protein